MEDYRFDRELHSRSNLSLVNFDLDQCTEYCDELFYCRFVSFAMALFRDRRRGCYIYFVDDAAPRTIKIDYQKELFCKRLAAGGK